MSGRAADGRAPSGPKVVPECVYVVAGGGMVAAFTDEAAAWTQSSVMQAAGLDPVETRRLAPALWVKVRAELRASNPDVEIADVTGIEDSP